MYIGSGVVIGSGATMGAGNAGPTGNIIFEYAMGNIQSANDQPWGYVANLELYNIKLTIEQLQQNYYYYKGLFGV